MRKRFLFLVVALALCAGLTVAPASAYGMGKADEHPLIGTGGKHAAAIDGDGSLWMWGENFRGGLGDGTREASRIPVKVLDNVAAVSCGGWHTAAIKTDGSLWMWGSNNSGQLGSGGNGNVEDERAGICQTVPVKVLDDVAAVSCGDDHTAAVKTDGSLWMRGENSHGELGMGTAEASAVPVKVLDNVAAVSCGRWHTAAIGTDGSLWTWGSNNCGQLGNDGVGNAQTETGISYQTVPVKVLDDAAAVSCGGDDTAVIRADGSLWMWGRNDSGQLGNGGGGNALEPVGCQTVPAKVLDDVIAVSCGGAHTAAVKTDGSLWMWGSNGYGILGNGGVGNETELYFTRQTVPVKVLDDVAAVGCGGDYTVAVKTDGSLWTWGYNENGQLGNGGSGNGDYKGAVYQTVPIQISLTGQPAASSNQPVLLDGKDVTFYMYQIRGNNYVKLRDLASVLSGTTAQFEVGYDGAYNHIYITGGQPYTTVGGEMEPNAAGDQPYHSTDSTLVVNGKFAQLEAYTINGYNYFKLRDLGKALGFNVSYINDRVVVASDEPYSDAQ